MGLHKRKAYRKQQKQNPRKSQGSNMALYTNTFSPFRMSNTFNDSFFKSSWQDGWMIQNPFKEFKSMFNEGKEAEVDTFKSMFNEEKEAEVDEDETKMEVRINASEYKPEELKVSVQSGRLLVEGKHEERRDDGTVYVQKRYSRSYTLPKEAQADQIVSNLSSEGVLVITTPKSAPAITSVKPKEK